MTKGYVRAIVIPLGLILGAAFWWCFVVGLIVFGLLSADGWTNWALPFLVPLIAVVLIAVAIQRFAPKLRLLGWSFAAGVPACWIALMLTDFQFAISV